MADLDLTGWSRLQAQEGEEQLYAGHSLLQGKLPSTDSRVPGRILGRHAFYTQLGAEPYIVQTVKYGYKLEFQTLPPPSFTANNKSAKDNMTFVKTELLRLQALGCIERVGEQPTIVLPLSLVLSNKLRLVIDASRGLNPHCTSRGIKLDDLTSIANTVKKGDFLVVNDLDSGFFHVPIHPSHRQYLGVHIMGEDKQPMFWVWKVLVLGLKDACHIFSRLIAPLMSTLRKEGMRGSIYIDDALVTASTKELALRWEQRLINLFAEAGWVFKASKRSGEPAQVCRYLGLEIHSSDMCFQIPEDKLLHIMKLLTEVGKAMGKRRIKVKTLARLLGTLQAVRLATGPIVSVMTRSLYSAVDSASSWAAWVKLDPMAQKEVNWWMENLHTVYRFPISDSMSTTPVSFEVASDASGVGYYSYLVGSSGVSLAARAFTQEERLQSSTWRELSAFHDTWTNQDNLHHFAGKRVCHYTDSQAMASIVSKGSRNPKLQPMVMEAVLALRRHGITMVAAWRSRDEGVIVYADSGSRDFHADDISLDEDTMKEIHRQFGSFDYDTFASASNKKGAQFYSKLDVPGSAGVDFFHQSLLPSKSHYCFPPPSLLVAAMRHFQKFGVTAVIIVPVWPNSSFFSVFWPDGRHSADFATKVTYIQPTFLCGPLVTSTGMRGKKSYQTAAMLVDFRASRASSSLLGESCLLGGCVACS